MKLPWLLLQIKYACQTLKGCFPTSRHFYLPLRRQTANETWQNLTKLLSHYFICILYCSWRRLRSWIRLCRRDFWKDVDFFPKQDTPFHTFNFEL